MSIATTEANRISNRVLDFFEKIRNLGMNEDDKIAKSIKQLDILSILRGFNKEVIKEATSKLLTNIVSGEEKKWPAKVHRR